MFTYAQFDVRHLSVGPTCHLLLPLEPPYCLISDRRQLIMNIPCAVRPVAAYAALIFISKETSVRAALCTLGAAVVHLFESAYEVISAYDQKGHEGYSFVRGVSFNCAFCGSPDESVISHHIVGGVSVPQRCFTGFCPRVRRRASSN